MGGRILGARGTQELEYLPAPPTVASDEFAPPGPPPSPEVLWVPPCWYWRGGRTCAGRATGSKGNRGGSGCRLAMCGVRGNVFVAGHWDYTLERRGVFFCWFIFRVMPGGTARFAYTPGIVLDIGVLQINLFIYPRYCHYYFGDYYDDSYVRIGIFPWFEVSGSTSGTTRSFCMTGAPCVHRTSLGGTSVIQNMPQAAAPTRISVRGGRTARCRSARPASLDRPGAWSLALWPVPTSEAVTRKGTPIKFEPVSSSERRKITRQATDADKFRERRNRWESPAASQKTARPLPEGEATPAPSPAAQGSRRRHRENARVRRPDRRASAPTERKGAPAGPAASAPMERKGPAPGSRQPPRLPSGRIRPRRQRSARPRPVHPVARR